MTKLSYNGSVCDICRNRHAGRGPSAAEAAPDQAHETKEAHRIEMKVYVCSICGYVYAEALGIPETGIAPGTRWEDLPDAWVCPLCKAAKRDFRERQEAPQAADALPEAPEFERERAPMELSVICSNLARGCEKQYLAEESALFAQLAEHYARASAPAVDSDFEALRRRIERDLEIGYPYANAVSRREADRGAQRALVWSEKVTRMLNSLLRRYAEEGAGMLEHSDVYVCSVCGFVSVGDAPPEFCPVCKVPGWKFEKTEGRAS